jgi:hypothetical protein
VDKEQWTRLLEEHEAKLREERRRARDAGQEYADLTHDKPVKTAVGMAERALHTLLAEWNLYALNEEGVNQRTIIVDTTGVSTLDFKISMETKQRLIANGQSAARKFLRQLPPS